MKIKKLLIILLILPMTFGCSALLPAETNNSNVVSVIASPTPIVEENIDVENITSSPTKLLIWLPPQFSPDDSEAGLLLQAQLNSFMVLHPTVRIETRIKAESGENNLVNSIYQASLSAPISLPDLIALPSQSLPDVINLDIITPLTEETSSIITEDSFEFASNFVSNESIKYGVPFASEILMQSYRSLTNPEPPSTWEDLILSEGRLAFPASDIQSIIPLVLYQSRGGIFTNEEQEFTLNRTYLKSVFELISQGSESSLFPFWLTQYNEDEQSWLAISENRAQLAINWSNNYLLANNQSILGASIPTKNGSPFTYGKGWMWSITNDDIEKQPILESLALYLSEPAFLSEWTNITGYYPTSGDALALWPENLDTTLGWQLLPNAIPLPSNELLNTLGSVIQPLTEQLLKQEIDAEDAIEQVFISLIP